jgi:hypothetical protein
MHVLPPSLLHVTHGSNEGLQGTARRLSYRAEFNSVSAAAAAAAAGTANGKIVLAQADSAVAMAQTEKVDRLAPISRTAWQN